MTFNQTELRRLRAKVVYYQKLLLLNKPLSPKQQQAFDIYSKQYDEFIKLKPVKTPEEKALHTLDLMERNRQRSKERYYKNKMKEIQNQKNSTD